MGNQRLWLQRWPYPENPGRYRANEFVETDILNDTSIYPSAQAEGLLSIRGVSKSFDGTLAVDDVDLNIKKGEIFALLGGSGSGKSTLLRMLAGIETPDSGRIVLDGQDITALPPYLRPTNMMFQSYALFPHMTVEQNIAYLGDITSYYVKLKISLTSAVMAIPPYEPVFRLVDNTLSVVLNFGNYLFLLSDSLYVAAYWGSVKTAFIATTVCLLMVMLPSWASFLIRVYAWMGILGITYAYLPFMSHQPGETGCAATGSRV